MLGIIVATHGHFAEELVNTSKMIMGETNNLKTVTLVPGEGPDDLMAKYEQAIEELNVTDGLIILCDLFGGSPYNAACRVAMKDDKYGVVTGVSLPMLLEVINYRLITSDNLNVEDAIKKALEANNQGAQTFHLSQIETTNDDEGDDL